jgi:AraC-like DNA-binding protein
MHAYLYSESETQELTLDTANVMCFYTDISVVDVHYHSCYQIVVTTKSAYDSLVEGKLYKNLKGFIIDKYTRHSCSAPQSSFLVYYIESRSFLGKQLKRMLNNEIFIDIETILSQSQLDQLRTDFSRDNLTAPEIKNLSDKLLYNIFKSWINPVADKATDSRIAKATAYINANLINSIMLNDVANHIHLSPERTRHLFLEQIEVPFSQYILWKRMKAVLIAVIQGKETFYDASLQYGFTSQSHFNRFFKRMFGISPTMILKNSRFVQFIYPQVE